MVVGTNYVFIYQLFLNLKEDREGLQYGVVVRQKELMGKTEIIILLLLSLFLGGSLVFLESWISILITVPIILTNVYAGLELTYSRINDAGHPNRNFKNTNAMN